MEGKGLTWPKQTGVGVNIPNSLVSGHGTGKRNPLRSLFYNDSAHDEIHFYGHPVFTIHIIQLKNAVDNLCKNIDQNQSFLK